MNLYPVPCFVVWRDKLGYHYRQYTLTGPNGQTDGHSHGNMRPVTIQQCRGEQAVFQITHPNGITHDLTDRLFINGGSRARTASR